MGCSTGTTVASPGSGSTVVQKSRSDEDLHSLTDQRKRKRMISNRESARRSRMRKQKHLDDLVAQAEKLQGENHQLISAMNMAMQQCMAVETENWVLRVQIDELSKRLRSLDEIIAFSGSNDYGQPIFDGFVNNHQHLVFTSAGAFQY